eukprot:7446481-Karenia_brevis.AAC.1
MFCSAWRDGGVAWAVRGVVGGWAVQHPVQHQSNISPTYSPTSSPTSSGNATFPMCFIYCHELQGADRRAADSSPS